MEVEKKKKKLKLVLLIAVPIMVVVISQQFWMPSLDFDQVWRTVAQHGILSLYLFLYKMFLCEK